jgi:prevent-host-death family protein
MLKTADRIITLTELQRNAAAVVGNAQAEPVAVTLRGRPVVYVVGVELFDELMQRLREREAAEITLAVRLSERQFAAGEAVSLEELEAELGLSTAEGLS